MKTVKLFPGMILSVLIAAFAVWLERLLPVHLIGAAVILNIRTVLHVGKMSLLVMIFTLLTCFGGGYFIGKALLVEMAMGIV